LAAVAHTASATTVSALSRDIEASMLSINHHGLALSELSFGGLKSSGYGSEDGSEAIEN
jgi:succinate-semialdehyde dehydrogenase/glutarate-semialdehyde dehydrogenase